MSEFVEQQIPIKLPADGQPHAASDNVAWTTQTVTAFVAEGIGLAYYPTRLNGETIYRVAHLASGKAISQPVFSARTPEQAECWIHRLCQDIDWNDDFPRLRLTSSAEMLMGYAIVGQLFYAEQSCSICHEFSPERRELADMQLCVKCYAPARDGDDPSEPDISTALYRFTLALEAIVRCAADHIEIDLRFVHHFAIIPSPTEGQVIVSIRGYDVFVSRSADGQLLPGFAWAHGDIPYEVC